jgi:hypothetical protein
MYTFDQFLYLQKALDALRDQCNAGWNVTILVQAASGLTYKHPRYAELADRLYCHSTGSFIPLLIENFGKIGFGLNSRHRIYMREHIEEFDYFAYAEEDMVLTVSHLQAYLDAELKLKRALPRTWMRYFIGFLRWEDSIVDTERVSWEYFYDRVR